jgi:hypothetical protein
MTQQTNTAVNMRTKTLLVVVLVIKQALSTKGTRRFPVTWLQNNYMKLPVSLKSLVHRSCNRRKTHGGLKCTSTTLPQAFPFSSSSTEVHLFSLLHARSKNRFMSSSVSVMTTTLLSVLVGIVCCPMCLLLCFGDAMV